MPALSTCRTPVSSCLASEPLHNATSCSCFDRCGGRSSKCRQANEKRHLPFLLSMCVSMHALWFVLHDCPLYWQRQAHDVQASSATGRGAGYSRGFAVQFDTLIKSLRRNFNGIPADQFQNVVETFLTNCEIQVPPLASEEQLRKMTTDDQHALYKRMVVAARPLDSLREALADVQGEDDMNHSPFRHVLGKRYSRMSV